jgi:hypothetical protein
MRTSLLPLTLALGLALPLLAQAAPPGGPPPGGPPRPEGPVEGSGVPAAKRNLIAWYGTWEGAKAEAKRSGKPILLLSAAPHCHDISGVW